MINRLVINGIFVRTGLAAPVAGLPERFASGRTAVSDLVIW
jgi:hypothetical protein